MSKERTPTEVAEKMLENIRLLLANVIVLDSNPRAAVILTSAVQSICVGLAEQSRVEHLDDLSQTGHFIGRDIVREIVQMKKKADANESTGS